VSVSRLTRQRTAPVSRFPYERVGDAELLEALQRGDGEAAGILWDRYAPLVRQVLRSSLGSRDPAVEDLTQETFLVLLKSCREVRSASAVRSYLVSVAIRLVFGELRRRRVRRWVMLSPEGEVPDVPAAPADTDGAVALQALYRLLGNLPDRRRLAFVLRFIQGLEMTEVASTLRISESTAKREVARARTAILARGRRQEPALWEYLDRWKGDADG
jgi:RNA polymerase sigma-70 factor (ECF subfamily)